MVHQSPTQSLHPWIDPMFDISGLCVASWISACFLTLGHRHTRDTSVENIISSEQVACTAGRPGMTIWLGSIFRGRTFILDPIQARKIVVRIESTAKQFKPISDLVGRLSEWNSIKLRIQRQTCGEGWSANGSCNIRTVCLLPSYIQTLLVLHTPTQLGYFICSDSHHFCEQCLCVCNLKYL